MSKLVWYKAKTRFRVVWDSPRVEPLNLNTLYWAILKKAHKLLVKEQKIVSKLTAGKTTPVDAKAQNTKLMA